MVRSRLRIFASWRERLAARSSITSNEGRSPAASGLEVHCAAAPPVMHSPMRPYCHPRLYELVQQPQPKRNKTSRPFVPHQNLCSSSDDDDDAPARRAYLCSSGQSVNLCSSSDDEELSCTFNPYTNQARRQITEAAKATEAALTAIDVDALVPGAAFSEFVPPQSFEKVPGLENPRGCVPLCSLSGSDGKSQEAAARVDANVSLLPPAGGATKRAREGTQPPAIFDFYQNARARTSAAYPGSTSLAPDGSACGQDSHLLLVNWLGSFKIGPDGRVWWNGYVDSDPRLCRILKIQMRETAETWTMRNLINQIHGLMRLGPCPNRVCGVAALELKRALGRGNHCALNTQLLKALHKDSLKFGAARIHNPQPLMAMVCRWWHAVVESATNVRCHGARAWCS